MQTSPYQMKTKHLFFTGLFGKDTYDTTEACKNNNNRKITCMLVILTRQEFGKIILN